MTHYDITNDHAHNMTKKNKQGQSKESSGYNHQAREKNKTGLKIF